MNGMKLRKPLGPAVASAVASAVVLAVSALTSDAVFAQHTPAQNAPAADSGASMVKPPSEASGGENPDNMPVKKPRKPTNDKMMHYPPASAANAK